MVKVEVEGDGEVEGGGRRWRVMVKVEGKDDHTILQRAANGSF